MESAVIATLHQQMDLNRSSSSGQRSINGRDRFLSAIACRGVDRAPLWMMRQAGRALPEYRELKADHTFLELVRTPDLATEVTLQPIRRFGMDAAILFSDILVIPEAMGQAYHFRETGGIQMEFALRSADRVAQLDDSRIRERLDYVRGALELIRGELNKQTALLGFAGSPWTLANFMIEGGSAREWTGAKEMLHTAPDVFEKLMAKLTRCVTEFLHLQIDAGADAIQIFDSLGGVLPPHLFEQGSCKWIRQIIAELRGRVPVIVFSKGTHSNWASLVTTGASALGIDWTVSLPDIAAWVPANVALQGNLDPVVLTTTPEAAARETVRVLDSLAGRPGHIFNLGHGVPPNAKLECIEAVVRTVQESKA